MIIIETTTRERLVLVPEKQIVCTTHTRDATPEDLARGGYVPAFSDLEASRDHYRDAHLHAIARAERAERERERDEARARAEKAELDAAEWEAEVDALRAEALAELAVARRDRDALRAELADAKAERDRAIRDCAATAAERNEARAEVARLGVAHERARFAAAGVTVARPEEAALFEVVPAEDRATDEELERVYSNAYARAWESEVSTPDRGERAGVLAVAARVRQERCLVTRAVGMLADVSLARHPQRGLGERTYTIRVQCPAEPNAIAAAVPAADVPATLARLLGEVERG